MQRINNYIIEHIINKHLSKQKKFKINVDIKTIIQTLVKNKLAIQDLRKRPNKYPLKFILRAGKIELQFTKDNLRILNHVNNYMNSYHNFTDNNEYKEQIENILENETNLTYGIVISMSYNNASYKEKLEKLMTNNNGRLVKGGIVNTISSIFSDKNDVYNFINNLGSLL